MKVRSSTYFLTGVVCVALIDDPATLTSCDTVKCDSEVKYESNIITMMLSGISVVMNFVWHCMSGLCFHCMPFSAISKQLLFTISVYM